jgi:hypothetical protein
MAPRARFLSVLLALSADARALEAPASYRYRMLQPILGEIRRAPDDRAPRR